MFLLGVQVLFLVMPVPKMKLRPIKTLLDGGISFYMDQVILEKSQTLLANCLSSNEIKREDILISTKIEVCLKNSIW